ncbi:hypothetical protein CRM22_000042 [Opisthorchis felineus]|uniref:EGF-like domain-containing protein n=1 Tax=Opisthorchis felineus TaxID=147828 RepID=A0A4S2MLP6_OPIFE|nr:hypothetical protein CRM22_000042 [Opisthorchis felineus]
MGSASDKLDKTYEDVALEKFGCDLKGTVLCPENETTITCLNGGACALYLKDLEDVCEQKCRCTPEYIGKYCHLYNGFLNATVGLMVGILLAIILTVFIVIIVWYCCNRKKRNSRGTDVEIPGGTEQNLESGHYARVPLSNRMDQQIKGANPRYRVRDNEPSLLQAENGQEPIQYPIQNVVRSSHTQKSYISRSYSTYDNVSLETEEDPATSGHTQKDTANETANESEATTHLLACDNADYGTTDNCETSGLVDTSGWDSSSGQPTEPD